jgi:hypothetical protein
MTERSDFTVLVLGNKDAKLPQKYMRFGNLFPATSIHLKHQLSLCYVPQQHCRIFVTFFMLE